MPLYPAGTISVDATFGFSEDSIHVSGDSGAFVLAVRNDAGTALAADGDYVPFTTDSSGALRVAASVAITYAYPEDSAHISGNSGAFILAVRNDAGTPLAADGDYIPFTTDATGALRVAASVSINAEYPEDSAHVTGDIGSFILAVRNDAGTPLAADGEYIPFTTDSTGALRVAAGVSINYSYSEDSPHVSADMGAFTLGVRNDGAATLTSADGDYSPFAVDSAGRIGITTLGSTLSTGDNKTEDAPHSSGAIGSFVLAVRNDANVALTSTDLDYSPIAVDADGAVQISDGGNSITVDGTVSATQGTSPWVVSGTVTADTNYDFAEDTAHTTGDIGAFVLAVRNDAGTSLVDTTGDYAPLQVDSTGALRVAASVAINAEYAEDSAHTPGDIGSFSLGVRNDAAAVLTDTNGDYSPFATDSAGRIGITDLGGSITVDGTVAISGTVAVDTNYDFAEDATHTSGDIGVQVLAVRNDTPGTLVSANGDYASLQQDGAGGLRVAGTIAHDTAIVTATHSPILTASRAQDNNTTITSVAAGDAVFNLADLKGVQFIKEQRPQLLGIYYGIFGPNQLTNAADASTAGRMWLVNTSATIAAAVRSISFEAVLASTTAMLTFPRITVERMTFTGTPTGASITPGFRASTDATNTATIRTASTGMTITAGAGLHNFIPPLSLTGVGTISIPEQKFDLLDHEDGRVILGQNQGIVIRQADGGTANDNRRFFISIAWEEYTV